jgi:hypothetical protein
MLAASSGVNADWLHQLSGGTHFFVTEVLAAGPKPSTKTVCRALSPKRAKLHVDNRTQTATYALKPEVYDDFSTADSTASVDGSSPTVIRAPPSG